jgi:hypothetical protein
MKDDGELWHISRLEVVMDLWGGNDQVAGHDCAQAVPI